MVTTTTAAAETATTTTTITKHSRGYGCEFESRSQQFRLIVRAVVAPVYPDIAIAVRWPRLDHFNKSPAVVDS